MAIRWGSYPVKGLHDELIQARGKPRPAANQLCQFLHGLSDKEIEEHKSAADLAIKLMGITFTVYSEQDGGAILFKSFKDGVVTVVMKGSCSGCPSSTVTLKSGIEKLLKNFIPEVQEVVAEAL